MQINHDDDLLALLARKLQGTTNLEENSQIDEWIKRSPENYLYFKHIQRIWESSDKQSDLNKIRISDAMDNVSSRILSIHKKKRGFWFYWQRIAAILIIPVAISSFIWIYFNPKKSVSSDKIVYNEINTAFGTRTSLRLSDSTLVWLNSGSSLRYPEKFYKKSRNVYLSGEAYFEVAKSPSRPFIVHTSGLDVMATGTKFNVLEYDSNPVTEVTLVSGKVFVNKPDNGNMRLISELSPNQHLKYNQQTEEKKFENGNPYRFIAWKDGKFVFRNEPLSRVLNKLSMLFNVDFELQGKELEDYRYHATFQEESLEEILKLLALSAPISFKEIKRESLPDGSFQKKKVIIIPAEQSDNK